MCIGNASKLFRERKRNTEADLDTNNTLKIQFRVKNNLHSELTKKISYLVPFQCMKKQLFKEKNHFLKIHFKNKIAFN